MHIGYLSPEMIKATLNYPHINAKTAKDGTFATSNYNNNLENEVQNQQQNINGDGNNDCYNGNVKGCNFGHGYGFPVDIWACGVILYTLLVGFPPFWHSNRMVLMRLIMKARLEFLAPYWDTVYMHI